MLKAFPMSLKDAEDFVNRLHRHHSAPQGDKFRVGCMNENNEVIGVVQCGRPVSRHLDNGEIIEVIRLCTDGTKNAASFLYSRAARIAKEMGYTKIITYILEDEFGSSLKASGWHLEQSEAGGGSWNGNVRPRYYKTISQQDIFGEESNVSRQPPTCYKQRWSKEL